MSRPSNACAALSVAFVSVGFLTSCGGSNSTAVEGDPASIEMSVADVSLSSLLATADLDATVRDEGGAVINATVSWSSDATSIASVSNQGVVTAVGNGTANVIATAGAVADTAEITVQQVAATLTLSPDTLRLPDAGDTATISRTVRDAGGSAMSGVPVTFATVDPAVATVNVDSGRVTAQSDGVTTITAQVAPGGSGLTKSIRVEVGGLLAPAYLVGGYVGVAYTDQIGPASGGGSFTYGITDGALPPGLAINASNAQITGTPGGGSAGAHFFEVTATNGMLTVSERYAITISTQPASAFNLWVAYNGGVMPPANARTALNGALARWEEIVTGNIAGDVTYPPTGLNATGPNSCQLVDASLLNGAFIEDIAILMSIGPIDGVNNTLARGGPCGYGRQTLPAAITGQMKLDEVDASAQSAAFLQDVIWHEIAHALHVGTIWQNFTEFEGTDSVRYYGTNGNAAWRAYGGPADGVPVELDIEAHWREGHFNAEIMTPQAESPGTPQPISRMTIGVLLDLGFGAVLGAADAYTLPGCSPACSAPARTEGGSGIPDVVFDRLLPLPAESTRD